MIIPSPYGGSDDKESACNVGDLGSISGLGRSPGEGHDNPLQYFLPGESSWTEEPGGLQSMELQRVRHDWTTKHSTFFCKASKVPLAVKNPPINAGDVRRRFHPCFGKIPWRMAWLYSTLDSSLLLKISILSIFM